MQKYGFSRFLMSPGVSECQGKKVKMLHTTTEEDGLSLSHDDSVLKRLKICFYIFKSFLSIFSEVFKADLERPT